jgi:vitellogenic carboxypeptidase-like protein
VLEDRPITWNTEYDMLFIDNPVGAGFSYTTKDEGYCKDTHECVARNLYSCILQFYTMFPAKQTNPLWITGESYGGHYVPAISYYIHTKNQANPDIVIPFKGCAIGDGWIDPVNMIGGYPDMIYNMGLCDENEKVKIQDYCDRSVAAIKKGDFLARYATTPYSSPPPPPLRYIIPHHHHHLSLFSRSLSHPQL